MRDPELSTEEINLGGCFYKHPSVFSPESRYIFRVNALNFIFLAISLRSVAPMLLSTTLLLANDASF
jgi:hypothetical protein